MNYKLKFTNLYNEIIYLTELITSLYINLYINLF